MPLRRGAGRLQRRSGENSPAIGLDFPPRPGGGCPL